MQAIAKTPFVLHPAYTGDTKSSLDNSKFTFENLSKPIKDKILIHW